MKNIFGIVFALYAFGLFVCGCAESEPNHPLLKKAAQSMRVGEYRNAELCYKKYLQKEPSAVAVHRALAQLYDEHLDDYLLAVYHYKEVLRLSPDMPKSEAGTIKGFIERCEQQYFNASKKSKKTFLTDEQEIERFTAAYKKRLADEQKKQEAEIARLKKELEAENSELANEKKEVSAVPEAEKSVKKEDVSAVQTVKNIVEKQPVDNSAAVEKQTADSQITEDKKIEKTQTPAAEKIAEVKKTEEVSAKSAPSDYPKMDDSSKTVANAEKTAQIIEYTVRRGDTFSQLSKRFYGTSRYYRKLMEYNKISNPNALRVGKKIKVPPTEVLKGDKK